MEGQAQEQPDTKAPDPKPLLDAANSASQQLAVLQLAFLAACAYVLIIVFGTKDLDLLVGKHLSLPVIGVEVPIVGFFAMVPYLVLLLHFNLLLQLQLLSRKLYALDEIVPKDTGLGGLRDQLHIFPYSNYMVGRPDTIVFPLIGSIVSITLVFLPLVTLCIIQLRFLAYQDESITWLQRSSIWLDLAIIFTLWPIIMDRQDRWGAYWKTVIHYHGLRSKIWWCGPLLVGGLLLIFFGPTKDSFTVGSLLYLSSSILQLILEYRKDPSTRSLRSVGLFSLAAVIFLSVWHFLDYYQVFTLAAFLFSVALAHFWRFDAPRGSAILLVVLLLFSPVPLAFMVDGEWLEEYVQQFSIARGGTRFCHCLEDFRRFNLKEQMIFANPASPGILECIRQDNCPATGDKIIPIDLHERKLRHAQLQQTVLIRANLRMAHLQGASLVGAQLWEADLSSADLRGADIYEAQLRGANLSSANLQGAVLYKTKLEGAVLEGANLNGAVFWESKLAGASLQNAEIRGAAFGNASLTGANFTDARLHCCDLRDANFDGAVMQQTKSSLLTDLRKTPDKKAEEVAEDPKEVLKSHISNRQRLKTVLEWFDTKGPLKFDSCLSDSAASATHTCTHFFPAGDKGEKQQFTRDVIEELAHLACTSTWIAKGVIRQIPNKEDDDSTRKGLYPMLAARLRTDEKCLGLRELNLTDLDPDQKKLLLRALKSFDQKRDSPRNGSPKEQ